MVDPGPDALLAAVDIGTNSIHMVVARVSASGRIDILEREKDMVRLGRSGGDMHQLTDDAIERGVVALNRCRRVAEVHGAELVAVATSAVREADNRRAFLDRAYDEAGVSVEVISGLEEARLIHLGVLQALPIYEQRMLLCDIGGGSTEIVLGHRGEVLDARSYRLGAIRLTQRYLADPSPRPRDVARARQHAEGMLATFGAEVRAAGYEVAVGASGTIETVVSMALAARGVDVASLRTCNGERVTADEIAEVVESIAAASEAAGRAALAGVDPRRVDILLGGAIILEQFVAAFGVEALTFSDYALREGVLLDAARRRSGGTLHHLRDLRRRSVEQLLEVMDDHPEHAREVARHALALFDDLRPLLDLDDADRELLEAAALLSNVGVFVSHSGHHRHSYYVIRNTEVLSGFTDREIELIAQVARYHRKSAPKEKHPEWMALRRDDRDRVVRLAGLLRVAIGLDRSHGGRVSKATVDWDDEAVRLRLLPAGPEPLDLEVHAIELRRGLLEDVLGRELRVST